MPKLQIVITAKNLAERAFGQLQRTLKKLNVSATGLRNAFVAVAASLAGVTVALRKAFTIGARVLETQSKFNTVFGESAERMDEFVKSFGRLAGLSQSEAQEIVASAGAIAQGFGIAQDASASFAEAIVRLGADIASFNNVSTERATRAIISGIAGEREQLKLLNIVLREKDVLERVGINTGKTLTSQITQQDRALASLQLISEKAGRAVGDLDRTQNSAQNTAKRIRARFVDLSETVSTSLIPALEQLLPILEKIAGKTEAMATGVANFVNNILASIGLTNETARVNIERVRGLSPDQLQGERDRLASELAGKESSLAGLQRVADARGFVSADLKEKIRSTSEEVDGLTATLAFLDQRIMALADTTEETAAAVGRAAAAIGGGGAGRRTDIASRGLAGNAQASVGGLRFGSAFGGATLNAAAFRGVAAEGQLERRLDDLMSEAEQAEVAVADNVGNMVQAMVSGSANMEQVIVQSFTNILQSIKGVSPLGGSIIGAVGGVFGALLGGGRRREPIPVSVERVKPQAARELAPARRTTNFFGGGVNARDVEREVRRRNKLDDFDR